MSIRWVKALLAAIVASFAVATVHISILAVERQNALTQVSRYNIAWLASQAVGEFLRLEQRITALGVGGGLADKDEVELRFDILVSRAKLMGEGEFNEFVRADPDRLRVLGEFDAAIAELERILPGLEAPGSVARAVKILAPLEPKLSNLASAANLYGAERVAQDQNELLRLHRLFTLVAGGLILCGIVLIVLLGVHNRLLGKAHADQRALAANLQAQEIELRRQNDRFDAALNNMSHGLCMVDAAERVIVCNDRFRDLFALPAGAIRPGMTLAEVVREAAAQGGRGEHLRPIYAEQTSLIRNGRSGAFVHAQADERTIAVSHRPMEHGGWVATYEDITQRKRAESQIAYMAHHDALTDLANRVLFREHTERALALAERHGGCVAMLCLDLDHFKDVNDTLGHQSGDAVLKAVARRLRGCVREGDVIARLGGDEFAVLQVTPGRAQDAGALATRLVEVLGQPYHVDGQEIVIGASVGIAVAAEDCASPDQLLKRADLALYRAKGDGRGTFRFFAPEMDAQLQARRTLETDLRKALAAGEFDLYYQPQVDLGSNAVTGYEALIRWLHPERGFVSPSDFIPVAEETGLVAQIGDWVVRQACREAATWPAHLTVAVNLSPVQFRNRTLVETVADALSRSGLAPTRLEVEITESVLLQDNDSTIAMLHQLRSLGVRVALDDFGTGYSSLSYLRSFPFDKIKIDQSFVRELSTRADCLAIVQSITRLGSTLRMTTTAEGVETEEQVCQLRAAGCDEAQGYLFGRPKPASELVHAPLRVDNAA